MTTPRITARRAPLPALVVSAIGFVLCVIGLFVDARRTAAAYLVAYVSVLAVVLGALAQIMIARLTAATWFVVLRRQAEQVAGTLPIFAVLFVPVLLAARLLYPWTAHPGSPDVAPKSAYLNLPFFVVRSVLYLSVWIATAELLRRTSLAQDAGDSPRLEHRLRLTSAVGVVVYALTVTFASFDWMMSLTPAWYSTIYGVDYFAGAMVGGLALIAVLVQRGRSNGELPDAVAADHVHALAKLILTFVLFWVYIGFSQFIVIWSAEIPVEASWYVERTRGGWSTLGAVLVIGHFVIPFCALLLLAVKRRVWVMAALGVWLLGMHYLDDYWIVMPDAAPHGVGSAFGYLLDLGALLLVGGIATLTWAIRRAGEPAVARGDPALGASLEYSTELTLS